jgi:tRNA (mo5U34)-methyltransferase
MTTESLQKRIKEAGPWFHTIDLGNSVVTPGAAPLADQMKRSEIYFGMGIGGLSVLDVGAWDGFYSFEAERRGASRTLAVDYFCWGGGGSGSRAPFELAREVLNSRVEDRILDIPETTVQEVGQFDMVLFNGIIYHIQDPIMALTNMAGIAKKLIVVETFIDNLDNPRPVMVYFGAENNPPGYPTNGWGPNSLLMHGLLKKLGFETVLEFQSPDNPSNRGIFIGFKSGHGFDNYIMDHKEYAKPRVASNTGNESCNSKETVARLDSELQRLSAEVEAIKDAISWRSLISAIRQRIKR